MEWSTLTPVRPASPAVHGGWCRICSTSVPPTGWCHAENAGLWMGSCAAPLAKGDDKFITSGFLQQCLKHHHWSHCGSGRPTCCHALICLNWYWKSMPGHISPVPLPIHQSKASASRTWISASAPCWWQKPVTPARSPLYVTMLRHWSVTVWPGQTVITQGWNDLGSQRHSGRSTKWRSPGEHLGWWWGGVSR